MYVFSYLCVDIKRPISVHSSSRFSHGVQETALTRSRVSSGLWFGVKRSENEANEATANLRTKIMGFRGFDSSRILM